MLPLMAVLQHGFPKLEFLKLFIMDYPAMRQS
jgi:hypothetical protein